MRDPDSREWNVVDDRVKMQRHELLKRLADLPPERRAELLRKLGAEGAGEAQATARAAPVLVTPAPSDRHEPFPLTDLQQAYWIGRGGGFERSDVSIHSYVEVELEGREPEEVESALNRLIAAHDMLRAVIREDGLQQVLARTPPYRVEVVDLRDLSEAERETRLRAIRDAHSHEVLPSEVWPLFRVLFTRLRSNRARLHLSMDGLIFDGWSLHLFIEGLARLLADGHATEAPPRLSFRDCVLHERAAKEGPEWRRAREYWLARLDDFPGPPELPLARAADADLPTRFARITRRLDAATFARLEARCRAAGLTRTSLLLAAYAEVLALWSERSRFVINVPRFNRSPVHPEVDRVIGEFASFTLLEVDVGAGGTFTERAKRVQERLWKDLDAVDFTGVEVLRELAQRRDPGEVLLMPIVFTASAADPSGRDAYVTSSARKLGELVFAINQTSQVRMDNHVHVEDGELVCDWDHVEGLYPDGMQESMCDAWFRLLGRLADDEKAWAEDRRATAFELLPEAQRRRLADWNARTAPYPDRPLDELFLEVAARSPDALALRHSSRDWTYGELERAAFALADELEARGVRPGDRVGILMEKSPEQTIAALGIVMTGAAYLPIDVESPPERLRYFVANSAMSGLVVGGESPLPGEVAIDVPLIRLGELDLGAHRDRPRRRDAAPDDLAVLIYTSGSTGDPKGVMVSHRNIVSTITHTNETFGVGPSDRAIALTALHHDLSEYDLFGMLLAGGSLVVPDAASRRDPGHWSEIMRKHGVTFWNTVPAMMEMMLEYADDNPGALPSTLRQVILGGDWVPLSLPARLQKHAPSARLLSIGGPTETTIWNVWYPVGAIDPRWRSIPYGKATANNGYHVLDADGLDCPDHVPGEMVCVGAGVTLGYWRDPEKTASRYGPHPRTGERCYRTGDRGRFLPDGNLEFLGRSDLQVKIQGQRIELGEIEAALRSGPLVRMAAVRVIEDARGKKSLAGYLLPEPGAVLDEAEQRAALARRLPAHMIPAALVILDRMPLTANGKIDRKALPEPRHGGADAAPPQTAGRADDGVLARVTSIVGEVLGARSPDPDEDLMLLGANSLDMVRIGNRLEKEFGRRLRIDELFRMRRIRALADYYAGSLPEQPTPPSGGRAAGPIAEMIASFEVLTDPDERDAFKKSEPGIRSGDETKPFVALDPVEGDDATLDERWLGRRSARSFRPEPVSFIALSRLLAVLRRRKIGGVPKYLYPSAGALYPVQTFLHAKAGRIEGLPGGVYYHRPTDGRLVLTGDGEGIDASIHVPFINSPVWESAAFSIFFVCRIAAIAPGYGEHSLHFATIEAGCMGQLLEEQAARGDIGLCHIGSVDFDRIRRSFDLDRTDVLIHSMLGGLRDPDEAHPWADRDDVEEGLL